MSKSVFLSLPDGGSEAGGALMLGSLVLAAGLLAIDHKYSPKGTSAWDKLQRSFSRLTHPHVTGAATADQELKLLPAYGGQVIHKVLTDEHDDAVLNNLASALAAAGMPMLAQQVRAKRKATT